MAKFDAHKEKYPQHADEIAHVEAAIARGTTPTERFNNTVDAFADNLKAARGKGVGHMVSGVKAVVAELSDLQHAIQHGL